MSKIESKTSSRSWFCVWNSPEKILGEELNPEEIVDKIIQMWIEQNPNNTCAVNFEVGDTGNKHAHMVLENKNKCRFSTIQKLFVGAHIEPTLGNRQQAMNYINKVGEFEEKAHTVIVPAKFHGEIYANTKSFTRISEDELLANIESFIEEGMNPEEIMSLGIKYRKLEAIIKKAFFAKRSKETPPIRDVNVFYHIGEAGTGKSYQYVKLCEKHGEENVYLMTDYSNDGTAGFDMYLGQPTLFMDEYKGSLRFQQLLNYLDGYKIQIHCRYANSFALWNEVHITSVYPPEKLYNFMVEQANQSIDSIKQLLRRINTIVYHYKENGEYKQYSLPCEQYVNYDELIQKARSDNDGFIHIYEQTEIPFED